MFPQKQAQSPQGPDLCLTINNGTKAPTMMYVFKMCM